MTILSARDRLRRTSRCTVSALAALFIVSPPMAGWAHSAQAAGEQSSKPAVTARTVAKYPLENVPGKTVTLKRVSFPPGATDSAHRHAGAVTVFVLSGAVRSQLDDGEAKVYKPGDTFFEPPGTLHTLAENASSTEPAELLAIFVAEDGATLTTPTTKQKDH